MITQQNKRDIARLAKKYKPNEIRRLLLAKDGTDISLKQISYYMDIKKARRKQSEASKRHYRKKKALKKNIETF